MSRLPIPKTLAKAAVVLLLGGLGLVQAPAASAGLSYCAGSCFVWNRNCVQGFQSCVCDAYGGAITNCWNCPDNDYMCIG